MNIGQLALNKFFELSNNKIEGKLIGAVQGTVVTDVAKWGLLGISGVPRSPPLIVDYQGRTVSIVKGYNPIHYYREQTVLEDFISSIEEDDVVYDVGAFAGLYACSATLASPQKIFAFEPLDERVETLKSNIQENGVSDKIQIKQFALGSESEEIKLTPDGSPGPEGTPVPVVPADDLSLAPPDVIKMDIEGGELEALKGMNNCLTNCRVAFIECHPNENDDISSDCIEIKELLQSSGLRPSVITRFADREIVKAIRDD